MRDLAEMSLKRWSVFSASTDNATRECLIPNKGSFFRRIYHGCDELWTRNKVTMNYLLPDGAIDSDEILHG